MRCGTWTPPEAQAYIRALEARVETLTALVHALQEQIGTLQAQLNQTSRNSVPSPVERSATASHVPVVLGVHAVVVVNRAILALRAP